MIALSVNVNKIALIRNSRAGNNPDLASHARRCIEAGADGITVHPRPDQRHIKPGDVVQLAQLTHQFAGIEFNIEGNPFAAPRGNYPGLLPLVEQTQPQQCTLVPDTNNQLTSDHGFDLTKTADQLAPIVARLQYLGTRVSLFMDADIPQIELARQLGVDRIELYTGPYAAAWSDPLLRDQVFDRYRAAARYATEVDLGVNAGHDLNLENLATFATVPGLLEVSIGHALIIDAINIGLHSAVQAYKMLLKRIAG